MSVGGYLNLYYLNAVCIFSDFVHSQGEWFRACGASDLQGEQWGMLGGGRGHILEAWDWARAALRLWMKDTVGQGLWFGGLGLLKPVLPSGYKHTVPMQQTSRIKLDAAHESACCMRE